MSSIVVNNRTISVSNLDKIWFKKSKITKGMILDYYATIAGHLLYHTKNHLLVLQRFPEGISKESFYQKNASSYFPSWIKTYNVPREDGTDVHYVVSKNEATLVYLVNQGVLTIHSWLSQYSKLQYPDRMIFDLDPSINNFTQVRQAALLLKEICDDLQIPCYPMTTGSRGIHVMVPLKRVHTFDEIAQFSLAIADIMFKEKKNLFTLEIRKNKRGKKIFIDTLRNRINATAVAPYSVRPIEKAPVATPLHWPEVKQETLTSQKYTIHTLLDRVRSEGDAWDGVYENAVSLKKLFKRVGI